MAELICPKCKSEMRTYERNDVTIEQCSGCGGLFLDRGELERLTQAEDSYYRDRDRGDKGGGRSSGGFLGTVFGHGRGRGHH